MDSCSTLDRLMSIADFAYQRARAEVFDTLPPGCRVDLETLTERQCQVLLEMHAADADVANYRQSEYENSLA